MTQLAEINNLFVQSYERTIDRLTHKSEVEQEVRNLMTGLISSEGEKLVEVLGVDEELVKHPNEAIIHTLEEVVKDLEVTAPESFPLSIASYTMPQEELDQHPAKKLGWATVESAIDPITNTVVFGLQPTHHARELFLDEYQDIQHHWSY